MPAIVVFVLIVLGPAPVFGQQAAPALDADRLPISVERIKRRLAEAPASTGEGLRLQYYVEVFGRSRAIDITGDFDLRTGPVPYGAPTHAELIGFVTPQEFRAPAADLLAPARLLLGWLADKSRSRSGSARTP